jgi:hypothetical protein
LDFHLVSLRKAYLQAAAEVGNFAKRIGSGTALYYVFPWHSSVDPVTYVDLHVREQWQKVLSGSWHRQFTTMSISGKNDLAENLDVNDIHPTDMKFMYKIMFVQHCLDNMTPRNSDECVSEKPHSAFPIPAYDEMHAKVGLTAVLIVMPLTVDGVLLRLWSDDHETASHVFFIPYGVCVYIRGDVLHAGGFCYGTCNNNALYVVAVPQMDTTGLVKKMDSHFFEVDEKTTENFESEIDEEQLDILKTRFLWSWSEQK